MEIEKRIPLGILTYRRPKYLMRTLDSFFRINYESLCFFSPVVVLVQGAEDNTLEIVYNTFGTYIDRVIELNCNNGCAWGYTLLNQELIEYGTDLVMHLQDDWLTTEPIINYLHEDKFSGYENNKGIFQLFEEREDVGYIRLRSSVWSKVSNKNRITGSHIKWSLWNTKYKKYSRLAIGNAHYTFNPTIIRTSVLKKILPVTEERVAMEEYHKLKLLTAHIRGNCFMHIGHARAIAGEKKNEKWVR